MAKKIFKEKLKYGENPWQPGAMFVYTETDDPLAMQKFIRIEGTERSAINLLDTNRMVQNITHIVAGMEVNKIKDSSKVAVAVKHGNACGAAVGSDAAEVIKNLISGDPLAVFGGSMMVNFPINEELAELMITFKANGGRRILDNIVCPGFTKGAIELLKRKKDKCRFVVNKALAKLSKKSLDMSPNRKDIRGGYIIQPNFTYILDFDDPDLKIYGKISEAQKKDIILAWAIGTTSNSNTISIVKGFLLGNGVGQQDRVGAADLAIYRAKRSGHDLNGAVAYSDSFFPFTDGPETLMKAGIKVILTSSGSVADEKVIESCRAQNATLLMIPDVKARGFFGH